MTVRETLSFGSRKVRFPIRVWWHSIMNDHNIVHVNDDITVGMYDLTARGTLYQCECGEFWGY